MIEWEQVRFFKPWEFKESQKLRPQMAYALDKLRESFGRPLIVTSSYRDPRGNVTVGGANRSAHLLAPDGFYSGIDLTTGTAKGRQNRKIPGSEMWTLYQIAHELGFRRIGIYPRHLHLDMELDLGAPALWGDAD